ncbi:glycosyltransferase, partial [Lysobacter sp. D1-1-M9]|uniref:glycosyltransferase n=1 Tax=Novilysobacter longmucuonensis TaxID=3098603 RepID=UPI002FC9033B
MQPVLSPGLSVVVPVYRNEESIELLLEAICSLSARVDMPLEAVFVVDGSPDRSYLLLHDLLPAQPFPSQLISLSRNFGAFAAI